VADNSKQSFWSTFPGVVTAVAALVSAIGVLIGSLAAVGVIGGDDSSGARSPATTGPVSADTLSSSGDEIDRITQYGGAWSNNEPAPNTVARIIVGGFGPRVNVHAFAACDPVDCDWGTRSPSFADPLVVLFDLGDGHTEKLTMLLSADATQLDVTERSSLTGTHEYVFLR
jgi:hypothetical protein